MEMNNACSAGNGDMMKLSFEDGMEKLESIVRELENGDMGLEDSFAAYEEGVKLSRLLAEMLDKGDARIRKITEDSESEMTE